LRLWRDFAAGTDLTQTRRPEVWAAALAYTFERMELSGASQSEIAQAFRVSPISISQKYRQIARALNLKILDARYLPEARRAAIQRDLGPFPEELALTEAPTGWWGLPSRPPIESAADLEAWVEARDQGPLRRAQDLTYEGWEMLDSDSAEAERCFREALRLDRTLADAHNGLGRVAEASGDLGAAETYYRQAYELARDALGTESSRAFQWWLELETRPYMRARQGLGWIAWRTGRYREALEQYEALLKLNKNDNQGVRYLIGPLYQLAGDLEGAQRAYERYAKGYPDDMGDPHHSFCWGLVLYESGQAARAVQRWRRALFENIYIAPLLVGKSVPEAKIWHWTNLSQPDYAEEYLPLYRALWDRAGNALACLGRLWEDREVQADVSEWLQLGERMAAVVEPARREEPGAKAEWKWLLERRHQIEERKPSPELVARVLRA
jgi:tetratricopeptide (TPR) repeat protein